MISVFMRSGVIALALAVLALALGPGGASPASANGTESCAESPISPSLLELTMFPNSEHVVAKCVEIPEVPPTPDIIFLVDTTSSMSGAIANVKSESGTILAQVLAVQPQAQFGVAHYTDQNCPNFYVLDQAITGDTAAVQAALNGLSTPNEGCNTDAPEDFINALFRLSTDGNVGLRSGSSRIVVLLGDSSSHDPSGGHSLVDTITALNAAEVRVVAVRVPGTPGFIFNGLDSAGQASALATATDGLLLSAGAASEVADKILEGLTSLPVEVEMISTCVDPITTTFDPATQTVVSGGLALFTETISVAADAPGGMYGCADRVLIDGELLLDQAGAPVQELKWIKVPEGFLTGGGQITNGRGRNVERVSFGGNVGYLADFSLVGQWQTNFHNVFGTPLTGVQFHSTEILSLQFLDDGGAGPNPPPANANVAGFNALGRVGQEDGWLLRVCLADRGEPGKDNDSIRLHLISPGGVLVYDSFVDFDSQDDSLEGPCGDRHRLDAGNFQIHSGLKD